MGFFANVFHGVRKVLGKVAPVVKKIGSFIGNNHGAITGLAHGIAMASGNTDLQKVTGVGVALSKMATLGSQNNAFRDGARDVIAYAKSQNRPPIPAPPS